METLVTIIHVLVSVFLIAVVLLQAGKGAEIGAVLGGAGSQTVFGGAGSGTFLSRLTVWAAVIFMSTSIGLTMLSGRGSLTSVMDELPVPAGPSFPAAATAPAEGVSAPAPATAPAAQP